MIKCSGREWEKCGALIFSEGNRVNVEVQRDYRAGLRGLGWGSPCSHWHCCSPGCTPCWRCASADANTEGKKTTTTDFYLFLDDGERSHWNHTMTSNEQQSPWQPAPSASGWGSRGPGCCRDCGWGRDSLRSRWCRCSCTARPAPPAESPPASPSAAGSAWSSPPINTSSASFFSIFVLYLLLF